MKSAGSGMACGGDEGLKMNARSNDIRVIAPVVQGGGRTGTDLDLAALSLLVWGARTF